HFSRFFPAYKMKDVPPTPVETIEQACDIARKAGIKYVYMGNVQNQAEFTSCPKCGFEIIDRKAYNIQIAPSFIGKCPKCGTGISGVWK
ncbi:MAG TPA: radical SAM protein, partial [Bacteroidales bacterium]|nr:radical SAM protein [Bacteroidales bacterium]